MQTKVTLVEWPRNPIQTVFYLWEAARSNDPLLETPDGIRARCESDPEFNKRVREIFEKVVDSAIPISENLNFVFLLEGVSISFREQMVRHKIGVKVGERFGVDMFPDLHDSTWWVQSMRVLDMGKFADKELYRLPDTTRGDLFLETKFRQAMHCAQDAYTELLASGVPIEDAREVIPLAAQHRLSWGLNLSALIHICKKRSCWIPQIGTWGPVIEGMVNELVVKVDPYFRKLVTPPCMKEDTFENCIYKLDNERRVLGEDPLMPCPLYLSNEKQLEFEVERQRDLKNCRKYPHYNKLEADFESLWERDTMTGKMK
jgi:hypothetical protein